MMPNSKSNMVDSKTNNNSDLKHNNLTVAKSNTFDLKHNNSTVAKSNTFDLKHNNSTLAKSNNFDLKHNNSTVTKTNNNSDTKNNNPEAKHSNSDVKTNSDSKTNADASDQGDCGSCALPPHGAAAQPPEALHSLNGNKVLKSGPLFLSSRGIGWTSWKKRWFVLTQTSLVFFRSDPNATPQRGYEANLTLGGIDLNSSGSVVIKADKKLLIVSFPDGRDGRSFTLKAETTEDLNEWKAALDEALANAPSPKAAPTGTLKNDKGDTADASSEQSLDKPTRKPVVLGRPILLALEDIDGTPSFLEKALRYVEDYGVKVEGILRQAADVEDVERRIREYEQGKSEFNEDEDAHVIGDCIKYVLRELLSSPVPASCCNALLEAYKCDRATRVSAMRDAICDTFPEPNRRLLQRMLIMMEAVAENKNVNRMSVSAVAACMAPLLLRPILACECKLDSQFDMGTDGSDQLMQAAAAANHAQAIIIILLEEYDNIFGEGDMLSDLYTDSDDFGSESEELSEDDYDDCEYTSEDSEHAATSSQRPGTAIKSQTISHKVNDDPEANKKSLDRSVTEVPDSVSNRIDDNLTRKTVEHGGHPENDNVPLSTNKDLVDNMQRSSTTADSHANIKHTNEMQKLSNAEEQETDATKEESKAKTEAADLLSQKKELETLRLQLKQDVARLEKQLQKELDLRKKLETGIKIYQQALFLKLPSNEKSESDGNSLNQIIDDLDLLSSNPGKTKDCDEASVTSQESKATSSSKDMIRSSTSKPQKLNSKNETTGSAMSKITDGLNYLKEKSNNLADELQNMNKDRVKSQSQKDTLKGSQDEFDIQSSRGAEESQVQHLDSHVDGGRRLDDQSTNVGESKI